GDPNPGRPIAGALSAARRHNNTQLDSMNDTSTVPQVSAVVPLYNEEPNIQALYEELKAGLEASGRRYEMVLVDDGSQDRTFELLSAIAADDPTVKIVSFRRNFGQTAAMAAGFNYASGDVVVTLDGDLQNDPADIKLLLDKIDEGYDLVAGWRFDRQDAWLSRKLPSMLANKLISKVTDVSLHDYGCTLKALRREVVENIDLYGELHRFIPAIASWQGVRIAEVKVNHRARRAGTSKYGISRTFRVVLDLITVKFLLRFASRPNHFLGLPGLFIGSIGLLTIFWLVFQRVFMGVALGDRPLLLLAIMLVVVGIQFIVFGLLAELQVRTYYESQGKRTYVVRELVGLVDKG
ncbi:unnamed protein product, partial [Cyprideis torosa]